MNYRLCLRGESQGDRNEILNRYEHARKAVSNEIINEEYKKWNELTADRNSKRLWHKIDWKGNLSNQARESPVFDDLSVYFENLYKNENEDDICKIEELRSEVNIPVLDDPINNDEIILAINNMKNGVYGHRMSMLRILTKTLTPLLLLIMNILFYISYPPPQLAISLLIGLPKKGNLSLPKNYRGIQMLPALAALFDRIITNRLNLWAGINDVQSAFQKGKPTIHQLFTIRLVIELAKQTNTIVFIGLFDLEKAFDKVSRLSLLKKLVLKGIGNCMLQVLKRLYSYTLRVKSWR